MTENVPKTSAFAWTEKSLKAAHLVAEDALTNDQIAAAIGIHDRTLTRWKGDKEFSSRVDSIISEMRAALLKHGVARLDRRMARLDSHWRGLQAVIEDRAQTAQAAQADREARLAQAQTEGVDARVYGPLPHLEPGMTTGLVTRVVKPTRDGGFFEDYSVDTALLAELRAMETQAAKELGQFVERSDVTSAGASVTGVIILPDNERDTTDSA